MEGFKLYIVLKVSIFVVEKIKDIENYVNLV